MGPDPGDKRRGHCRGQHGRAESPTHVLDRNSPEQRQADHDRRSITRGDDDSDACERGQHDIRGDNPRPAFAPICEDRAGCRES